MFGLPSSPVLNQCWPCARVDPPHAPVVTFCQKSPITRPVVQPPALTSPFTVNAWLIVIPGGAVVIQKPFSPSGIALPTWIVIGQLDGTMNAAGSAYTLKALQLPPPSVTQSDPARAAGAATAASRHTATDAATAAQLLNAPRCIRSSYMQLSISVKAWSLGVNDPPTTSPVKTMNC